MKRVRVVLIGLAVFSLTVAVVWAAEETAWAKVKSSVAPQPAAKAATEPVVFYMRNGPQFIEPGETRVSKGGQAMATDFLVAWDVDGDLDGTLTIAGGHSHMNTTSRSGAGGTPTIHVDGGPPSAALSGPGTVSTTGVSASYLLNRTWILGTTVGLSHTTRMYRSTYMPKW